MQNTAIMKNQYYRTVIFCLLIAGGTSTTDVSAQTPNWEWGKIAGGSESEVANAVVNDNQGNAYFTGSYLSTPLLVSPFILPNSGMSDFFVTKTDLAGNVLWTLHGGGISYDYGNSVTCDLSGNIYVAGNFRSPLLTLGGFSVSNTVAGYFDIFLAKINPNGNVLWVKKFGGSGDDLCKSVASDGQGNVYISGMTVSPMVSFNSFVIHAYNFWTPFTAQLDENGNALWATAPGRSGNACLNSMTCDRNGNCYMTGYFFDTLIFGSDTLHSTGNNDVFLVKLDPDGNFSWMRSGTSPVPGHESGNCVTTDLNGAIYMTGVFESTIQFDNIMLTNNSVENNDFFIVKFDSYGNAIWGQSQGGSGNDICYGLSTDASGNLYATGCFYSNSITLGATTLINSNTLPAYADVFVMKLDPSGSILWATSGGGSNQDVAKSISVYQNQDVFIAGYIQSNNARFDNINLSTSGNSDILFAKLGDNSVGLSSMEPATVFFAPDISEDVFTLCRKHAGKAILRIFDESGRLILERQTEGSRYDIRLPDISPGLLFYQLTESDGSTGSGKLVKQ